LFGHLDVVLMPYLAANYAEATSGIFAEAMALAKPVVVPSETWMASELKRSGGGVEFQCGNEDDLAAKVVHLVSHFNEYASKAKRFSLQWKSFHNSHTLTEILLEAGGLSASHRTNQEQE
jgi:glycosyltransferase involved in cell wall biosynthesis